MFASNKGYASCVGTHLSSGFAEQPRSAHRMCIEKRMYFFSRSCFAKCCKATVVNILFFQGGLW